MKEDNIMGKNYKYDVISSKKTTKEVDSVFPKYFLGNTTKEASALLSQFEPYINSVASTYSLATNIEKSDYFIEGVEALAKANKDFDPNKGLMFAPYAKFIIVDAMNEFLRKNRAVVQVPAYINKVNKIIYRIKKSLAGDENNWFEIMFEGKGIIPKNRKEVLNHDKKLFENAASRAKITCKQLADRAEFLPTTPELSAVDNSISSEMDHDKVMARILVDKVMPKLNSEEQIIAELIMLDLNNSEIAKLIKKSDMFVADKIKNIRKKALKMISGERDL